MNILTVLPKLYLTQKPRQHSVKEKSTSQIKGFQFTKTSFIMGLRSSWNRKVLNGPARKHKAGKSSFAYWFHFGCRPPPSCLSSGELRPGDFFSGTEPSRHGCSTDETQIQLFLLRGVNALGGMQQRAGMAGAHRESGALGIHSGFRLCSLTLSMVCLLVFPELSEPPSTIIINNNLQIV